MTTQSDLVAAVAELVSVTNVKLATLQGKVDEAAALRQAVEEALEESPSAAALQVNLQGPTGAARIGHEGVDVAELLRRLFPVPDSVSAEAYAGTADRLVITDLHVGGIYPYNPTAPNSTVRGRRIKHPSGVGAYERDIGSDPINVRWLGVKGDGSNEEALIQAAAAWAREAKRGLYFPTAPVGYYAGKAGHLLMGDGLAIFGDGMPVYSTDWERLVPGTGTIFFGLVDLRGSRNSFWEAGIDSGPWAKANIFADEADPAGVYQEGLRNTHTGDPDELATYKTNFEFGDVRVLLCPALDEVPASHAHGLLVERVINVRHGFIELHGGWHGYAMKSLQVIGTTVAVHGQRATTVIFKSDDDSALCGDVGLESIRIGHPNFAPYTAGRLVFESKGRVTRNIRIGTIQGRNCDKVMCRSGDLNVVGVTVGHVDYSDGNPYVTPVAIDSGCIGWNIATHRIRDCLTGFGITGGQGCDIGSGSVTGAAGDGYQLAGDVRHGNLRAENCGGWGVKNDGAEHLDPSLITTVNCAGGSISGLLNFIGSILLSSPWEAYSDYGAAVVGQTFKPRGLIRAVGSAAVSSIVLTVAADRRPKTVKRGLVTAFNANTSSWGPLSYELYTSGQLVVYGAAGLGSGGVISLDGLEWYVGLIG